jgi:hypothetical protein
MKNTEKEDTTKPGPALIESIVPDAHGDGIAYRRRKRSPGGGFPRWLLAGFGLFVCYVFFMLLIMPVVMAGVLTAKIERNVGWQVEMSSFKITPFSWRWEVKGLSCFLPDLGEDEPFFRVSSVSGTIDFMAFLKGRVRAVEVFVDSPEVLLRRSEKGEFIMPVGLAGYLLSLVGLSRERGGADLSALRVENGLFVLDDLLGKSLSRIENISFRSRGETKAVSVQMLVNGEPLAIGFDSDYVKDCLRLDFDDFEPGPVLPFLLADSSVAVSGSIAGNLQLRLAGAGDAMAVISGEFHLDKITLGNAPDKEKYLAIPRGRVSFTYYPAQQKLTINDGVLSQPVLEVGEQTLFDLSPELKRRLSGVTIRNLIVEQGKFKLTTDLQTFSLHGLDAVIHQKEDSLPIRMQISAAGLEPFGGNLKMDGMIFVSEGETVPVKQIAGRIQMSGIDTSLLPDSFNEKLGINTKNAKRFQGIGGLDSEIVMPLTGNEFKPVFSNLKISLKDMQVAIPARLSSGDSALVFDGGDLLCLAEEFTVGEDGSGLFCNRLDIRNTDLLMSFPFTDGETGVDAAPRRFRNLEIKESRFRLVGQGDREIFVLDKVAFAGRAAGSQGRGAGGQPWQTGTFRYS